MSNEARDSHAPITPVPCTPLAHDPLWPRAGNWPTASDTPRTPHAHLDATPHTQDIDMAIIGIPTSHTSLSPNQSHTTPAAIRAAIQRYSPHFVTPSTTSTRASSEQHVMNELLTIIDDGDVDTPDTEAGETLAAERVAHLASRAHLVIALGGDNALTVPAALGVAGANLSTAGLITVDAHHDLRDGRSNGSPVRRLIEAGLNPKRIVQIGIADFANSRAYRDRAEALGITVIHRDEFHTRSLEDITHEALSIAGSAGGPIHVDLDVDVCDRSVAPACPASLPGGIQAHELRRLTRLFAAHPQVRGIDIAEIDAAADTPDGRTVRLASLCVLEAAAGLTHRLRQQHTALS